MRTSLIALSVILVMGCVPYSDNPLSPPGKEQTDSSLLGTWFWKSKKESGYVHIGLDKRTELLRVLMVDFEADGEMEVSEFSGHTSSLEGKRYLNLKWLRPSEEGRTGYMIIKYLPGPESLGIALMDRTAAENAIKKGSVKGKVTRGELSSSVRITEGQEELRKFVVGADKELFPEMNYVRKLRLPDDLPENTR